MISDGEVEVVWPLPVPSSKTPPPPPNVPITRPQYVSPVRQKVKYLDYYYVIMLYLIFFCFQKPKYSAFRPKVINVCSWSGVSTFDSLPPLSSYSRPAILRRPNKKTLVTNRTPQTAGLPVVKQAIVQETENLTKAWDIQPTDTPVLSSEGETFSMADFGINSCEDTSNSSSPTPIPENTENNTVLSAKSTTGAQVRQVNC